DLVEQHCREAGGERSMRIAGKAAVEIASVRQVARVLVEAVEVGDRHQHEAAAEVLQVRSRHQLLDDADAVELVAMQTRDHEQRGAGSSPPEPTQGNARGGRRVVPCHRQEEISHLAWIDLGAADGERTPAYLMLAHRDITRSRWSLAPRAGCAAS